MEDVLVVVGTNARKRNDAGNTYRVESWKPHEMYDKTTDRYGIGLIRVSGNIDMSKPNVKAIRLPEKELTDINDTVLLLGFGPITVAIIMIPVE